MDEINTETGKFRALTTLATELSAERLATRLRDEFKREIAIESGRGLRDHGEWEEA